MIGFFEIDKWNPRCRRINSRVKIENVRVLMTGKWFKGDSMQMCFVQRWLMCCSLLKKMECFAYCSFLGYIIFLPFLYKRMKRIWYIGFLFYKFNECQKVRKALDSVFPVDFYQVRTKGLLDGLFIFSKSEKHIKNTYPSHGFIFAPGRGWARWDFQFYRVWKAHKEDSKGFLFHKFSPSRPKKR